MGVYLYSDEWLPWENTYLYYPLISNANDLSWNSRNGTISWTANWNNGAVFNADWRIKSVDVFPSSFTVSVWVKKGTGSASEQVLWAKRTKSGATIDNRCRWGLVFDASNTLKCFVPKSDYSSQTRESLWSIDTTNWHNIVYTYENSTRKVYVDTVLKWNYSRLFNASTNFWLWIWWWYDGTNNMVWTEKDFIIESVARTADEISNYYNTLKSNYWIS